MVLLDCEYEGIIIYLWGFSVWYKWIRKSVDLRSWSYFF